MYENAIPPDVIMNGSKFMKIKVAHLKMKFIDSRNFIPIVLSKIPKAFILSDIAKGYFPYLFNKCENQKILLYRLPDITFYNPGDMVPENRYKFMGWYKEHKHDHFHFEEEIIKYCRSDVDILNRECLKFRSVFMQMTSGNDEKGIDPFAHCITIALPSHLVFRKLFVEEQSTRVSTKEQQSVEAMQWIKYHA